MRKSYKQRAGSEWGGGSSVPLDNKDQSTGQSGGWGCTVM